MGYSFAFSFLFVNNRDAFELGERKSSEPFQDKLLLSLQIKRRQKGISYADPPSMGLSRHMWRSIKACKLESIKRIITAGFTGSAWAASDLNTLKMNCKPLCGHKVGDPLPACIAGYCMGATAWGLSDAATDYSFIFAGLRAQKFCCLLPAACCHHAHAAVQGVMRCRGACEEAHRNMPSLGGSRRDAASYLYRAVSPVRLSVEDMDQISPVGR